MLPLLPKGEFVRYSSLGQKSDRDTLVITVQADGSDAWRLEPAIEMIRNGGVGIIPTDTLPALVADLENRDAVVKLYQTKNLDPKKPLSILCRNFQQIAHYTTGFPAPQPGQPNWFNVCKRVLPGPYTIILPASKNLPSQCVDFMKGKTIHRKSVGVRLSADPVCQAFLDTLDCALLTTSVHVPDMLSPDTEIPDVGSMMEKYQGHGLDFIIDVGRRIAVNSTIVDMTGPEPEIVREGQGDASAFEADVLDRRLERMLPPYAKLHRIDNRPLHEQVAELGDAPQVLIPTTGVVDRAAIMAAKNLKLIAQPASGYDNIDVAVARERAVPVTLAPGYNSQAVAEVALCMMLMLSRRIDEAERAFQRGVIGEPVGNQISGKILGIIGMGRVGKCLARAAEGLGMEVVGVTSESSRADLDRLLSISDVVSLHCPLTAATEGLIGQKELGLMKRGALIINCARGPVIQKQALLDGLESGHVGGAGLDCHWIEPADPQEPLYKHPRVLALPHLGSISQEVYDSFARVLCENIVRVKSGEPLLHELKADAV